MKILVIGLLVFFGIHLVPSLTGTRSRLVARFGENGYKILFSLVAMLGLGLVVAGMARRDIVPVWEPPPWSGHLAMVVMVPSFILLAAAYLPGNIKRFTRHPMLWGVTIWAVAHLPANGDLGSILLFGGFAVYSLFDMWSANRRGAEKSAEVRPLKFDIGVVTAGFVSYVLFFYLHPYITGVAVTQL